MTTVAIIGLGAVTRHIHMPAYAQLSERVRVVAGCDTNPAARQEWTFPTFDNPREMLASVRPDVVSICTPPWLHREQVLLTLEHGCHVFCEKPLADDLAQADDMIRASEQAGRLVVINNQFPYMKIHLAAKQQIGTPGFGSLLYLHAWHTMRTDEVTEAGWRGELARRLCFEFGIHVFELVRFFFNDTPTRILAHMPNPGGRARCDTVNVIAMEFPDGRGASIVLDRATRGPEHYLDMRLDGESAIVHTAIGGRVRLAAGIHTRDRRPFLDFAFIKGGRAELQSGTRSRLIAKDGLNPFADATAYHFAGFLDAIRDGTTPRGSLRDNRNTLALVMAAYDSAAQGRWVEMDQYGSRVSARNAAAKAKI
jgi:predicted dehydrogenase